MYKKLAASVLCICLLINASGCNLSTSADESPTNQNQTENIEGDDQRMTLTNKQREILEKLGSEEQDLKQMEEKGLSYTDKRLLDTAEKLLGYLETKYDKTFIITGGGLKGTLESRDFLVVYEESNPANTFRAYVVEADGDEYYEDEYYSLLSEEGLEEYLEAKLSPILGTCYVSARMYRSFGVDYTEDLGAEEAIRMLMEDNEPLELSGNVYMSNQALTDEEFKGLTAEIKSLMENEGMDCGLSVYNMSTDFNQVSIQELDLLKKDNVNYSFHEYIVVFK